jgi:hypothetical protein
MPMPLQFGDPGELGPFRLESRLYESAAGIVYLGVDHQGRPVEVALLTTAAAGDAAARDRFRVAVAAEAPRVGAFPRTPPMPGPGDPAPVVAALPDGGAPWVATAHEEGRPGAERFLRPVLLHRGWGMGLRRRGTPNFQQYWGTGPRGPALQVKEQPPEADATPQGDGKGLAAAVVSLAALLALLGLLLLLLYACEPSDPAPRPTDIPTTAPLLPPPPSEPSPSQTSPRPAPKHSKSPRPTPTNGDDGTVNPAARPAG